MASKSGKCELSRYCVWRNEDDRIIAIDETAQRCAELMGVKRKSFYHFISKGSPTWTIIKSKNIGG